MSKQIVIIQGHPDTSSPHYCHALADSYFNGAEQAGHEVKRIDVASLEFPVLRSKQDFETGQPPESIREAQEAIVWADHLLIIYPLWLGTMPALLKAFLEQLFRPGFAFQGNNPNAQWDKLLSGRSARVIVTMGMPAIIYRWYFHAYSLKSLQQNILKFCGIEPVKTTLIGMVESAPDVYRKKWLEKVFALGQQGA